MKKQAIQTENAPAAIGPYSQAVRSGNLLFLSGQIPIDPKTGSLVSNGIEAQAVQAFENLRGVLDEAGASFDDVVKTTVYLTDLKDFAAVNEIYGRYFRSPYPARACVEVSALPKGALIEVELIAMQ